MNGQQRGRRSGFLRGCISVTCTNRVRIQRYPMLEVPRGAFWGLGLEATVPDTEHTLPHHQPEQSREDSEVVRTYVQQMR